MRLMIGAPPLFRRLAASAVFLAACSSFAQFPGADPVPAEWKTGFDAINVKDCRSWLTYLSSRALEGRGSGQPGFFKAADFMAKKFKSFGLKPMGDNGTYFQKVPFQRSRLSPSGSGITFPNMPPMKMGKDIGFTPAKDLDQDAPVVFVRARGTELSVKPELIEGKIVIYAPASDVPRRTTFQLLQAKPVILLTVSKDMPSNDWSVTPVGGASPRRGGTPQGRITREAAQRVVKASGSTPDALDSKLEAVNSISVRQMDNFKAHVRVKIESEQVGVPNVVGLLQGSDPELSGEVVGVGAHLDHLGKTGNTIYPGADDDGSGSTALLAVANAMSKNPVKPKRSVLFMAFCGEELGLVGSKYLSEHPPIPLDKMICELQMDMVGRDADDADNKPENNRHTLRLVGSKRISTRLDDLIQEKNKYVNMDFKYDQEAVYTRSDHYHFAEKGVPIAFLFDGFHPDYHRPTDTVDKINFEKLANAAKLYYLVAAAAAGREKFFERNAG